MFSFEIKNSDSFIFNFINKMYGGYVKLINMGVLNINFVLHQFILNLHIFLEIIFIPER